MASRKSTSDLSTLGFLGLRELDEKGFSTAAGAIPLGYDGLFSVAGSMPGDARSAFPSQLGGSAERSVDGGLYRQIDFTAAGGAVFTDHHLSGGSSGGTFSDLTESLLSGTSSIALTSGIEPLVVVVPPEVVVPPPPEVMVPPPPANNAPVFGADPGFAVAENAANGTIIGTVTATDADGDGLTFFLNDDIGGRFAINAGTGDATVANGSLLNFETDNSGYDLHITVTDGNGGTTEQVFHVALNDVAELPVAANGRIEVAPSVYGNAQRVWFKTSGYDPDGTATAWSVDTDNRPIAAAGAMFDAAADAWYVDLPAGFTGVDEFRMKLQSGGDTVYATYTVVGGNGPALYAREVNTMSYGGVGGGDQPLLASATANNVADAHQRWVTSSDGTNVTLSVNGLYATNAWASFDATGSSAGIASVDLGNSVTTNWGTLVKTTTDGDVAVTVIDTSGVVQTADQILNTGGAAVNARIEALEGANAGLQVVSWVDTRGAQNEVWWSVVGDSGFIYQGEYQVGGPLTSFGNEVVSDGAGGFYLINGWFDGGTGTDIAWNRFTVNGAGWSFAGYGSLSEGTNPGEMPTNIDTCVAGDNVLVTWSEGTGDGVRAAIFDRTDGSMVKSAWDIAGFGDFSAEFTAVASDGTGFLVVGRSSWGTMHAAYLDASGNEVWSDDILAVGEIVRPDVHFIGGDRFEVVWNSIADGNTQSAILDLSVWQSNGALDSTAGTDADVFVCGAGADVIMIPDVGFGVNANEVPLIQGFDASQDKVDLSGLGLTGWRLAAPTNNDLRVDIEGTTDGGATWSKLVGFVKAITSDGSLDGDAVPDPSPDLAAAMASMQADNAVMI